MKTKPHIRAFVAAALALCCLALHATDEHKNRFHIDNRLYAIYSRANLALSRPECLLICDTLMAEAIRIGDVKAQCLALDMACSYYIENKPIRHDEAKKAIRRERDFAIRTPYKQYIFGGWGRYIGEMIDLHDSRVVAELTELQKEAFRLKNGYGIARSYELFARLYSSLELYNSAIEANKNAIYYQEKYGNPAETYRFHNNLSELYYHTRQYDLAFHHTELALASKYATATGKMRLYFNEALIYEDLNKPAKFAEAIANYEKVYRDVEKRYRDSDFEDRLKYLKVIYYTMSPQTRDIAKAQVIAETIKTEGRKSSALYAIYRTTNNYKAIYELNKKYKNKNRINAERLTANLATINKLMTQSEAELKRSEIDLANQQLSQQQTATQAELARQLLTIEQKENEKRRTSREAEMAQMENRRHQRERQNVLNQTRMIEEQKRLAELDALEAQRDRQKYTFGGMLAVMLVVVAAGAASIYYQSRRAKSLRRLRSEATAAAEHKDKLIDHIQQGISMATIDLRTQVERIALQMAETHSIGLDCSLAIQRQTNKITSTVDNLIAQIDPNSPDAKVAAASS